MGTALAFLASQNHVGTYKRHMFNHQETELRYIMVYPISYCLSLDKCTLTANKAPKSNKIPNIYIYKIYIFIYLFIFLAYAAA